MKWLLIICLSFPLIFTMIVWERNNSHPYETYGQTHKGEKKITLLSTPSVVELSPPPYEAQTFNNCGPASLSMVLNYYKKNTNQIELGNMMRPFNNSWGGIDDKSVFPEEIVQYAQKYDLLAVHRPNGSIEKMKQLVSQNIPVIVRTWLNTREDIGHYRIVRGYNDERKTILQDDSYQGPDITYEYNTFEELWQPFNYSYIVIYPKEKKEVVEAILGQDLNEKNAWENVLKRSATEQNAQYNKTYIQYNQAVAYYYIGDYSKSIQIFEKIESQLPWRMLWYQPEPIYAYQRLKNQERVMYLTNSILFNGNLAFSELYQARGEVYLALGNKDFARQEFENALNYNTNYESAQRALQYL